MTRDGSRIDRDVVTADACLRLPGRLGKAFGALESIDCPPVQVPLGPSLFLAHLNPLGQRCLN